MSNQSATSIARVGLALLILALAAIPLPSSFAREGARPAYAPGVTKQGEITI